MVDTSGEGEPLARGTLAETPLCHVALYLYRHTRSGTLVIDAGKRTEAAIRFNRGRPTAALIPFGQDGLLGCLLPLCGLRAGTFEFFAGDLLAGTQNLVEGVVDPYALLTASLDDHVRQDMVDAVLKRYEGMRLRIQPGRDLERLRLGPSDAALIELIRAQPATVSELVAQAPLPAQRTRRVLYALLATHMVNPHHNREGASYRSQVDLSGAGVRAVQINEVAASSPPAWARLASLRPANARSLRPVTPAGTPASFRPGAVAGSARPASPSGEPPSDDPAARVRRIEQLVQRARHDEALGILDGYLRDDPSSSELLALRAHALFEKHRARGDGVPKLVIDAITAALEADSENPRALFTRGLLLQRAGDAKKALAYFRRVVRIDPKHIEAQRELRLAKLRGD